MDDREGERKTVRDICADDDECWIEVLENI